MKCGAIFSEPDVRDYRLIYTAPGINFPQSFELRMRGIKNQGDVGSCVAHSLASIIEYYNYNQTGDKSPMSVGYIYGNRLTSSHKTEGMIIRDALEAVRKYGDVPNQLFPYNEETPRIIDLFERQNKILYKDGYPNRISQYCKVETPSAIKASLYSGNPVLVAINWYSDMKVVNGILTTDKKGYDGGHCMLIYGWDENGWKVQNSWGEEWGNNGCMIIPYDFALIEVWTLTDNIINDTIVKKPFNCGVGKIVAKTINKVNKIFNKNN